MLINASKIRALFFILSLFWGDGQSMVFGQTINCNDPNNSLGGFEVDFKKGCTPHTINIVDKSGGATNIKYSYDYNVFTPTVFTLSTQTTKTFSSAGTYSIVQTGEKGGVKFSLCKNMHVQVFDLTNAKINFNVIPASNSKVSIVILNGVYDKYEVDWGDGVSEPINQSSQTAICHDYSGKGLTTALVTVKGKLNDVSCDGQETRTATISSNTSLILPQISRLEMLNDSVAEIEMKGNISYSVKIFQQAETEANFQRNFQATTTPNQRIYKIPFLEKDTKYCFQVEENDACGLSLKSNIICSIPLKANVIDKNSSLVWKPTASFSNYLINRDGNFLTNASTNQYKDNSVECGKDYCYRISSQIGTSISISSSKCLSIGKPDTSRKVTEPYATFIGNAIKLAWQAPKDVNVNQYQIFRSNNSVNGFEKLSNSPTTDYFDATTKVLESVSCYKITYQDECKNLAPFSTAVCPVFLNQVNSQCQWSSYKGFKSGIQNYQVERLTPSKSITSTTSNFLYPIPDEVEERVLYRIKAIAQDGQSSYSNTINFVHSPVVFLPEIFTPNNDGKNEEFKPEKTVFVSAYRLEIHNRWGELVFTSDSPTAGWKGDFKNNPASEGTYLYTLDIVDFLGRSFRQGGKILLKR